MKLQKKFYPSDCIDEYLYEFVCRILENANVRLEFLKKMEQRYGVLLFGGCVRDYLMFGMEYEVRDLDFVIVGAESDSSLEKVIKQYLNFDEWKYNQFGGFKIITNNLSIDCWRIESTYAFRTKRLAMCAENLIDTPMLNIDRYVYSINERRFIANCNHFFPKEVDFHLYDEDHLEINLVRALYYSRKYNLKLSSAVKKKLKETVMNEIQKKKMIDFQEYHFKKEKIDLDDILRNF